MPQDGTHDPAEELWLAREAERGMVQTARYGSHILIRGPGLDHVLEPDRAIVIVDDFYADYYGDYIFLGYDVYVSVPSTTRGDTLTLFEATALLDKGPSVVVCGDEPETCFYTLAAHMALHGTAPEGAYEKAAEALKPLYSRPPVRRRPPEQAVEALHRLGRILGEARLSAVVGLGDTYNYGWGRLHYGETLAWLAEMGADDATLAAAALHYLTEGPGEPQELLEIRINTLGEAAVKELLGPVADEALKVLTAYARGDYSTPGAALMGLVELLGPGSDHISLVERRGATLLIHCSSEEALKDCVETVGKAAEFLEKHTVPNIGEVKLAKPG